MNGAITIQDIDEATAAWITEEAERRHTSEELVILELIHKGMDVERNALLERVLPEAPPLP